MAHLPTSKNFGKRIRALREHLGLSITDIGAACKLSANFIERVEKGVVSFPAEQLQDISRALQIDPEILVAEYVIEVMEHIYARAEMPKPLWKVVPTFEPATAAFNSYQKAHHHYDKNAR